MRFLADESCDFGVVLALRKDGHDVLSVAEIAPRAEDDKVIRLALRGKRILLTEDKDFGHLVFGQGRRSPGVVFIRYPSTARKGLAMDVVHLVRKVGTRLTGAFVVVQPGKIRLSRVPR